MRVAAMAAFKGGLARGRLVHGSSIWGEKCSLSLNTGGDRGGGGG